MIRLLTLNIWGAPYAPHRTVRNQAIIRRIGELRPDVALFQEVYIEHERDAFMAGLRKAGYAYQHYFGSGVLGSGLLTVSRYPILATRFLRFRLGGKAEDIRRGDFYAGKGIGLARIQTPESLIDVYNTHPHAQYAPEADNEYNAYTDSNLYEAAQFINAHSSVHPVILAGDLNTRPDQRGYALLRALARLDDPQDEQEPNTLHITFATSNPHVTSADQRLDYVLTRPGHTISWRPGAIAIALTENLPPEDGLAYSDHYGVLAELEPQASEKPVPYQASAQRYLQSLVASLEEEAARTRIAQSQAGERLGLATAALVDFNLTLRGFRRILRIPSIIISLGNLLLIASFAAFLIQGRVNLSARLRTLRALIDEIRYELDA